MERLCIFRMSKFSAFWKRRVRKPNGTIGTLGDAIHDEKGTNSLYHAQISETCERLDKELLTQI